MPDLKVCRICLRTEAKMYNFNLYQLKFDYEEVMALKVNEEDGLPHYFCYECATMLHKFHKFKEKCYYGQKVLKELLWSGPITYEAIYKIDRKNPLLNSPLSIMIVTDRVKTYTKRDKKEVDYMKFPNIENIDLDYFSEASLTAREVKNELTDEETKPNDDDNINKYNDEIEITEETINNSKDELKVNKQKLNDNDHSTIEIDKTESDILTNNVVVNSDIVINNNVENSNVINSPSPTYIDAENGIILTDSEELKDIDKDKRLNTSKLKSLIKDKNNWKITLLSEDDALKEFRAKAEGKKYLEAAFKCKECIKGFSKKNMLDRHIQLKHIEELGKHECRFCRYRFKFDCYLKKHMRQHYTRYNCLRCDLHCSLESTAILHEEYHSGIKRKCIYCDEEFRHSSTYYSHLRTHRSEHVCTLCGASFVSKMGLHQHKHIKHIIVEIDSPDDDEEVNTYCKRCEIRFETRKAYEEHLFHSALHSDNEAKLNTEVNSEKNAEERSDSPERISASKKILGKKVQAKITNQIRKRSNENNFNLKISVNSCKRAKRKKRVRTKPTTCHQCGKHFVTQAACMKHHVEAHPRTSFYPPNERYICEICGSSLAPGSIANHQNMHSREKLHTCDTCGKQFHAIIGLRRHMVTHTGERPYACPLCDKRFTQSNSMKLHYNTFHLKQPYPKRNRRKKKDVPMEVVQTEKSNTEESSDESLPDVEPQNNAVIEPVIVDGQGRTDESLHYLTLS